jgi:hypothetical protein
VLSRSLLTTLLTTLEGFVAAAIGGIMLALLFEKAQRLQRRGAIKAEQAIEIAVDGIKTERGVGGYQGRGQLEAVTSSCGPE